MAKEGETLKGVSLISNNTTKIYEQIADHIIEQLENGVVPWRKPWTLPPGMFPQNVEGKQYRGINAIMLGMTTYLDPRWITFRKARELGGHVRRGEKGMPIVFWKRITVDQNDPDDETSGRQIPMLKRYTVFNVSQCEDLPLPEVQTQTNAPQWDPKEQAEQIVRDMPSPPQIAQDGGTAAFYRVGADSIHMPPQFAFDNAGEWYSTLVHELSHSTGHPKRLNRDTITTTARFGSPTYSKEELVAEFGAAYLCHLARVKSTVDNSAAYIGGWLRKLKSDKRLAITAASLGQKAADHVLGSSVV